MGFFDEALEERRQRAAPVTAGAGAPGELAAPGTATAYAVAALRDECDVVAGTPEGSRDDALNRAAFRMGRHVGAGNIEADTVRTALADAARRAGLPEHEIERALRDGSTGGLANGMAVPRHPAKRPEAGVSVLSGVQEHGLPTETPSADVEDDFWRSRELLDHIHTYARARMVAPWAVLGCALARIVTATPWTVCLPPTIGTKQSLNMFVGLVGPSGAGKGAAEGVAAEAVQVGYIESHNTGSGEGIAHGFRHREKGELVWNDDRHAVLFSVPEIDSMAAQGDRRGATLMPQLRSAWSGEALGFGYADPMKRIPVPAHQYRMCLVAGIQPGRAGSLLDDTEGGTPQRFLWLPATDPTLPDIEPQAPSPMSWEPPSLAGVVGYGGSFVEVCERAQETIREAARARGRGKVDALDGHALLCQLKTAAALGIAEGRYSVTEEDWHLAGVVAARSAATRSGVVAYLADKAARVNLGRALGEAERALLVDEKKVDAGVKRVCRAVVRGLSREGDWLLAMPLKRSIAGRDREHFEEAVERLLETGQVEVETVSGQGQQGTRYRLKGAGA